MKQRLDKLIVERGLAQSRERACALVMEGKVLVAGHAANKPGSMYDEAVEVTLKGEDIPYVSRGGLKLKAAMDEFGISLEGIVAVDIGASTGGFTDCMLEHGATKVYAIDVGYGQLHWKIQKDPRVVVMDRTNIRLLDRALIVESVGFASVDVSFISLKLVLPKVNELLSMDGQCVALVKPQFEVGKGEVGKGGIVRDEAKRLEALEAVKSYAQGCGFDVLGTITSPITGQKGNVEYLLYLKKVSHVQ